MGGHQGVDDRGIQEGECPAPSIAFEKKDCKETPGEQAARDASSQIRKERQRAAATVLLHRLRNTDHRLVFKYVAISLLSRQDENERREGSGDAGIGMEAMSQETSETDGREAEAKTQLDQDSRARQARGSRRTTLRIFLQLRPWLVPPSGREVVGRDRSQASDKIFLDLHPWPIPPWGGD